LLKPARYGTRRGLLAALPRSLTLALGLHCNHRTMRAIAVVLLGAALTSCKDSSRTPGTDSGPRQTAAPPTPLDSATAVRMAAGAFGWKETDTVLVQGYRADSAGALVRLIRLCAPDADCYGAGGTVRVGFDGIAQQVPDARGGP
jgi:hypothetical protein